MGFNVDWDTAAGHAQQEIVAKGLWTCPCQSCVRVRARIWLASPRRGCAECGQGIGEFGARYCGNACRQKAYRVRKKEGAAK